MPRNSGWDKEIGGEGEYSSFLFPLHVFAASSTQKSNFDAKRSGKPDGNTLSPVDILRNMTLLGNAQSLFSVAWPLLNFSWLGKAAYRLGVHWKKHIGGCVSVKGLQRGEEKSCIWCHILQENMRRPSGVEYLLEFLWVVVFFLSDLWEKYMWWGKRRVGRGLYCGLGTL